MFEGQRIYKNNIQQYINHEPFILNKIIPFVPILLQNDYGEASDCTLVSLTSLIKFLLPNLIVQDIYKNVEKIAKSYGYNGATYGTPNLVIKSIINKTFQFYNIPQKAKSYYLKNIGFDYEDIKFKIDSNRPVILNLWKDGRNYYKNHTVLITGYCYTEHYKLLIIHDNWFNTVSYLDYNKLSNICSIQTI